MIILGLDVASKLGWAVYDTDKTPSSIISGSIKLEGEGVFAKITDMRRKLPKLIREHQPDFAVIEAPEEHARRYVKKPKKGQPPLITGQPEVHETTINPKSMAFNNRLNGAAVMVVLGQNIRCVDVRAQTWQAIIPGSIRSQFSGEGAPKKRAAAFCDMLKIVSPNMDSRDACIIAYWAAGHCQELKLLERARAA